MSTPALDAASRPGAPATAAEAAQRLSFAFARRHGVLVQEIQHGTAVCACRQNVTVHAVAEVRRLIRLPVKLQRVPDEDFDRLLRLAYETGGGAVRMMDGLDEGADLAHLALDLPEQADLLESDDDAPIIRLINAVLTQAVKENASDIHVEPFENRLVIRFRVDGVLREVVQSKRAVAPLVVSRIKVMSKLDIAEKRLPQDGRITPAHRRPRGRRARLHHPFGPWRARGAASARQAGRAPRAREPRHGSEHARPAWTSSSTSRTASSSSPGPPARARRRRCTPALERLNDNTRNIMTVEDPIEYYIDGIGQTQVNTKVEMTFARGLRAILRQDPDVVMVGEIRDLETAQIAVQASLTGHLVLSTLHTNTAVGAVTRLRDMGIEPFLLSSSLIGVVAQRLVRVLDPATRVEAAASDYERRLLNVPEGVDSPTIFRPERESAGGGYRGRTGIYELVLVDDQMRTMIHDGAAEHDLERYARTLTPSIRDDGRSKILEGETTIEEVLRVTRED